MFEVLQLRRTKDDHSEFYNDVKPSQVLHSGTRVAELVTELCFRGVMRFFKMKHFHQQVHKEDFPHLL